MAKNVTNSQVADRGGKIENSKNENNVTNNQMRKESAIISFVVATISSIVASYVYEKFLK